MKHLSILHQKMLKKKEMENEIKTETEQQIEKQTPTELIEITQQVTQKLLKNNDQRWWIKQILWPPFPTTRQNNSTPRQVSIVSTHKHKHILQLYIRSTS
jgi:hypothetical protein